MNIDNRADRPFNISTMADWPPERVLIALWRAVDAKSRWDGLAIRPPVTRPWGDVEKTALSFVRFVLFLVKVKSPYPCPSRACRPALCPGLRTVGGPKRKKTSGILSLALICSHSRRRPREKASPACPCTCAGGSLYRRGLRRPLLPSFCRKKAARGAVYQGITEMWPVRSVGSWGLRAAPAACVGIAVPSGSRWALSPRCGSVVLYRRARTVVTPSELDSMARASGQDRALAKARRAGPSCAKRAAASARSPRRGCSSASRRGLDRP